MTHITFAVVRRQNRQAKNVELLFLISFALSAGEWIFCANVEEKKCIRKKKTKKDAKRENVKRVDPAFAEVRLKRCHTPADGSIKNGFLAVSETTSSADSKPKPAQCTMFGASLQQPNKHIKTLNKIQLP